MKNSVISKIISDCKNSDKSLIRNFNEFKIIGAIGNGQQGIVFKIANKIDKHFALKFYHPTDDDPKILEKSIQKFINEVNILATLNHKNIVKIYTGGFAKWDDVKNLWVVQEGFKGTNKEVINDNEFYYYIMDFIEGHDLSCLFPEYAISEEEKEIANQKSTSEKVVLFESLINQVSKAMIYYHSKNITHKDIKPKNIRYCTEDSTFVIVDFGFAHHNTSQLNEEIIVRTEYLDAPSILAEDYQKNDMGQFSNMLSKVLSSLIDKYKTNKYVGLELSIKKGNNSLISERYNNMGEFYTHIKQYFIHEEGWKFQLKIDEYLTSDKFSQFDSKLRIPISQSLLLSKEVKKVIDTPEFQRLRGVRQLGPTMFVFPGANHTRFEHSLGVYSLSLRYLEKLLNFPDFRELCDPIDDTIKIIVLSALLHDIGHYPYSHWVEEIKEFSNGLKLKSHEERASDILKNSVIGKIIESEWKVSVDDVVELIKGESNKEIINSIMNSLIDIDKLDYLYRDSFHCGVSYGRGIDTDRLLDSLHINTEMKNLCVTEKGQSVILQILTARNSMYQAVYWQKTVRASEAMFKRIFYEYVSHMTSKNTDDIKIKLEELFQKSDDEFTSMLSTWAESSNIEGINELIKPFAYKGRNIYKPAYIYFAGNHEKSSKVDNFFKALLSDSYSYKGCVDMSNKFSKILNTYITNTTILPLDIIFEAIPIGSHAKCNLGNLKILKTRKCRFDPLPNEMTSLNDYLSNNRQAYIFCHPRIYDQLRELLLQNQIFEKLLNELYKT